MQQDQLNADLLPGSLLQQEVDLEDQLQHDDQQGFLALIGSFSTQAGRAGCSSKMEMGRRNCRHPKREP